MAPQSFALAALLGLAGCITSSFPKTPAEGGPAWQGITSEHFVVVTDLEPREANLIVEQLENLRGAMGETVFGREPPPAAPARVLALRNDEYRHFDRTNVGVFVFSALFQPMLITQPRRRLGHLRFRRPQARARALRREPLRGRSPAAPMVQRGPRRVPRDHALRREDRRRRNRAPPVQLRIPGRHQTTRARRALGVERRHTAREGRGALRSQLGRGSLPVRSAAEGDPRLHAGARQRRRRARRLESHFPRSRRRGARQDASKLRPHAAVPNPKSHSGPPHRGDESAPTRPSRRLGVARRPLPRAQLEQQAH